MIDFSVKNVILQELKTEYGYAGLSDEEKGQLLITLIKLRKFHDNLYKKFKKKSIEDIFDEVVI